MSNKLILSASSIGTFKACPWRFRNAYVYGIRPIEDKESQRVGTFWHLLLETAALVPGSDCPNAPCHEDPEPCMICEGTNVVPDDIMAVVTRVLNKAYEGKEFADPEAKEIERVTLLHALAGYRWHYNYYREEPEPVVATEQYFSLPLLNPQTGHPIPDVFIKGRIDKLIEIANGIAVKEHKSTSKSIDPDSTYWGHLNLDAQTTMYIYAARRMQQSSAGGDHLYNSPLINTVKYDVYHKPTIRPKKLTQGDSKKFVADGMYCGQKFEVVTGIPEPGYTELLHPAVNGVQAYLEPGAKEGTFAIRETPDMFGARLLKDITERPEFYFRCIELTRTDAELKAFEQELYDIAQNMQFMIRSGRFYTNEHACEATFRCDYIGQCYNREIVDQDHVPDGFKCIFRKDGE